MESRSKQSKYFFISHASFKRMNSDTNILTTFNYNNNIPPFNTPNYLSEPNPYILNQGLFSYNLNYFPYKNVLENNQEISEQSVQENLNNFYKDNSGDGSSYNLTNFYLNNLHNNPFNSDPMFWKNKFS